MTRHFLRFAFAGTVGVASALCAAALPMPTTSPVLQARPDDGSEYQKIIDAAGPSLVTVKFVLKTPDDQGLGDAEQEITGIVIDPKGLILCSYFTMGGAFSMFGGSAPTPQDVKVLIGDDTEGKKARVLSHDSDLDLAWVKLEEEPSAPLKYIDIEKGAEVKTGDRIFLLSRLDKYFDRTHVVNEGRVRGITHKPRQLYVPGRNLLAERTDLGMPIFNADANIVGVAVVQFPDKEAMQATDNVGGGPMILPIESVAKATKRALEATPETAKPDAVAPKPEEKPQPQKKD